MSSLNKRLDALEARTPMRVTSGAKERLKNYLDQIAERSQATDEQREDAAEWLRNQWPACVARLRHRRSSTAGTPSGRIGHD